MKLDAEIFFFFFFFIEQTANLVPVETSEPIFNCLYHYHQLLCILYSRIKIGEFKVRTLERKLTFGTLQWNIKDRIWIRLKQEFELLRNSLC